VLLYNGEGTINLPLVVQGCETELRWAMVLDVVFLKIVASGYKFWLLILLIHYNIKHSMPG